jgi:hypothetical protein
MRGVGRSRAAFDPQVGGGGEEWVGTPPPGTVKG